MKHFLFSLVLLTQVALASDALTTNTMDDVYKRVQEQVVAHGADQVLLVLDIDNTILTAVNELGSDQWYSWQEKIMTQPNCEPQCITKDTGKLIEAQGLLFAVGKMKPTEEQVPAMIRSVQAMGVKAILLTSRGPEFRNLTEKALAANGYDFSKSTFNAAKDVAGTYLPYDITQVERAGLSQQDIQVAGLKAARPVSFMNGVYMTAGQNKGVMLKTLLNKYGMSYKAIVFADDHQRHVDRMQAIMGNLADVTTYRYGAMDSAVDQFNRSDKAVVTEQWYKLQATLKEIGF